MLDINQVALKHSMSCFFNSYLRDMSIPYDSNRKIFTLELLNKKLELKVSSFSSVGAHQFEENSYFLEAAKIISGNSKLYSRLINSIHNMTMSFKFGREQIETLYSGRANFLSGEQGLVIGHNFHPTPKSRDEFSDQDLINYAPEFGAKFKISWFLVRPAIMVEERSNALGNIEWQKLIYKEEVPTGYIPYPVHPWQKNVLLNDPVIQAYLLDGSIIEGRDSNDYWYATSSLRTVYNPHSPFMLKFSISVRMTNSMRHLQAVEVSRGMQIQDVLKTKKGQEFQKRFPNFKVIHEPAFMGIKDPQGKILPQTVALLRENPFQDKDLNTVVLATLTQSHPFHKGNLISTMLSERVSGIQWFEAFLNTAIAPLLVAQADYGLMLGAHQQNLLIKLEQGLPVGAFFRDCQGTGFSQLGLENFQSEMPHPEKFSIHFIPENASTDLFTYYLVINSVLNTIAAMAIASELPESTYVSQFQNLLLRLRVEVKDKVVIDHLLDSPILNQKGNFRCSIQDLNENTTDNPLSIYNQFPNPFYLELSK